MERVKTLCAHMGSESSPNNAGLCQNKVNTSSWHSLRLETLPKGVIDSKYAVRGEIVLLSQEIQKRLNNGEKFPFKQLLSCNIGNPQSVGQNPITFHRQMLSLLTNPALIEGSKYPADVIARAKTYLKHFPKFGAYSNSKGIQYLRGQIVKFINERDGPNVPKASVDDIFITDGASPAVKTMLEMLITSPKDAILIPIPQYPLYSASIVRLGGKTLGYELDEDYDKREGWKLDLNEIRRRIEGYNKEFGKGHVKAICAINPGNPTGNVLSRGGMEGMIRLCEEFNLVLLADEVYQANVYVPNKTFVSFRQLVLEMGARVELASFHSISKGYYGECGLRGGYAHLTNIRPDVNTQMYKLFSMCLCSNTIGQAMIASIMNPPKPGDPSYPLFEKEKNAILSSLKRKAKVVANRLNSLPGVDCMPVEGAMYAFPRITLPAKFIEEAKKLGKSPEGLYCIRMLEETGVVTVPGDGFGQKPGTAHYRITILPPEEYLEGLFDRLGAFHKSILTKYQ